MPSLKSSSGFTLVELMVASAAASIIALSAFLFYGQYHRTTLHLQREYIQYSGELVDRMKGALPYGDSSSIRIR